MKKILLLLITSFIFAGYFSLQSYAQESGTTPSMLCNNGYTDSCIYYEVYHYDQKSTVGVSSVSSSGYYVTQCYKYYAVLNPPLSRHCLVSISSITYTGTIYLYKYHHENGNTYAYYHGTLYPIE